MLNGDNIREPDENSGPALLGREPILFPEEREEMAEEVKDRINNIRE